MGKHTPAPWGISSESPTIIKKFDEFGESNILLGSSVGGKTSGPYFPENDDEVQANAILMAAAPELLDSLECLLDMLDPESNWDHPDIRAAKRIIAKATGGAK